MKTKEVKENGNEQKANLKQKLAVLAEEKINALEKINAEFKARIATEKKEDIAKYEKTLVELEHKASDMKKKLQGYTEEGKD